MGLESEEIEPGVKTTRIDAGADLSAGSMKNPQSFVRLALVFYAALALVAFVWRSVWAGEPLFYASEAAAEIGVHPLRDGLLGLLLAGLVILGSREFTRRTRSGTALARSLAEAIGPVSTLQVVWLALASGIGEEAFFRGALQPRVGLVAASLLFGLAHFVPRRELWVWSVFSILVGLLIGGLFEWTGNLLAPIVAHAGINAVNLKLLARDYGSETELGAPVLRE